MGIPRAIPAVVALCSMVATSSAPAQPIGPFAHRDAIRHAASRSELGARGTRGARRRPRRTHGRLTSDRTSPIAAPGITGTIYYVSALGSDSSSGTSPADAWKTVSRVDRARLAPGDGVLFQGGGTFGDQVLMPDSSGMPGRPIVYGSYGGGVATLPKGAWFVEHDLAFENLAFGATFYGGSESKGASNDVTLDGLSISLAPGNQRLGLYANGDHWVIENSSVSNTGLSGMLLNGDDYLIADNAITNTGLDATNGYNNHGIYLDASDTMITGNTIVDSAASAISVRYRNSTIAGNMLSGGQIGIDFYESDKTGGHSLWTDNTLSGTTIASVFVCGTAEGCREPLETITISGNKLTKSSGTYMNLQPTRGGYTRVANQMS
jgi:Right handed beta helix region